MPKRILALLLTLCLSTGLLAASAYLLGTSAPLLLHLMRTHAPAEATGLPEGEYPAVAAMTAAYLAGETETFQHSFSVEGTAYLAFNEREQQHMADVQGLFRLARGVMVAGVSLSLVLMGGVVIRYGRAALRRMLAVAGLIILAVITAIALAAAIDFEGLFVLFHRIAFTNDLWLLDPRTDLLIRLMPTSFFVSCAMYIGIVWALAMGLVILIPILLTKERNK